MSLQTKNSCQPKLKIRKNDLVQVIAGKDKGRTGKVLNINVAKLKVTVEGVNFVKKHMQASQDQPESGIIRKESPIHYSNIMLVDSKQKPTRIGIKVENKKGKIERIRIAKTTGETIKLEKAAAPKKEKKKD